MSPSFQQAKYHDPNPVVSYVIRRFFRRVGQVVSALKPNSLLDAGCGEGELLRRDVLPVGMPTACLDLKPQSLAAVRAFWFRNDLVCASVESLPFASKSFDVVLCLEVLEHREEPVVALREMARVASRAVVVSVPHEPYFRLGNLLRGKYVRRLGDFPEHVQHWNLDSFHALLSTTFHDVHVTEAFPWIIARCRP